MAFTHSGATSVSSIGDERIDGVLSGESWRNGEIFYSATDSAGDYGIFDTSDADGDGRSAEVDGYSPLTNRQIAAVRAALDTEGRGDLKGGAGFAVEGFTTLTLTYAGYGSGEAEIRIANSDDAETAYAYYPARREVGGDVWFGGAGGRPIAGNYDYFAVLHELGHALGLKHAHEVEADFAAVPEEYDTPEYTVMTYRPYEGASANSSVWAERWGYAQSFMMLDIAALQYMYGANYTVNSGNTTYSWVPDGGETRVNGKLAIDPGGNRIFATIWDGGGTDTYDLSAYGGGVDVDLRPGRHSVFKAGQLADLGGGPNDGFARGNIFNALLHEGDTRSLIENAIGGRGNDSLLGNEARNALTGARGRDTLAGGEGADTLTGGRGADMLQGGDGADKLHGGQGADTLQGARGADKLVGGPGDDVFRFTSFRDTRKANPDVIMAGGGAEAFEAPGAGSGDLIDLSRIDADRSLSGDQAFRLDDTREKGTIWLRDKGGETLVQGDADGDGRADFRIRIADGANSASDYTVDDFIL